MPGYFTLSNTGQFYSSRESNGLDYLPMCLVNPLVNLSTHVSILGESIGAQW
jgi:hypothetical protein